MKAEHQFYAHALTPRRHATPADLVPLRVLLDGLSGLGALSVAAASADLSPALPDRFRETPPHAGDPARYAPASVELLLHQGPLAADSPWWPTLASGALIVCTGHDGAEALPATAHSAALDLGEGVHVILLSGPVLDELRELVIALGQSMALAQRIAALVTACQSQIAWEARLQARIADGAQKRPSKAGRLFRRMSAVFARRSRRT